MRRAPHSVRVAAGIAALLPWALAAQPVVAAQPRQSASDAGLTLYAVGDIADCRRYPPDTAPASQTARLVPPGSLVLGLGDMAYQYADAATLAGCYEPTWGQHRATTLAIAGNHDYVGGSARDFREYFAIQPEPPAEFVAYSRWLTERWLLVALDSNVRGEALQHQYEWLQRTLTQQLRDDPDRSSRCLLVMWHAPVYSSGFHRGSGRHMQPFWNMLDDFGADLLLSGHEHFYEAFAPIGKDGRKSDDDGGIRQFVVGTGGARLHGFWRPPYASRARVLSFGVMRLTLDAGGYSWSFIDDKGRVRDQGTAACRRAP